MKSLKVSYPKKQLKRSIRREYGKISKDMAVSVVVNFIIFPIMIPQHNVKNFKILKFNIAIILSYWKIPDVSRQY